MNKTVKLQLTSKGGSGSTTVKPGQARNNRSERSQPVAEAVPLDPPGSLPLFPLSTPLFSAVPDPWDLVVRPSSSAEPSDASFSLEDEATQEQLEGMYKECALCDISGGSGFRVIYCSKGFCQTTGFTRDEILGKKLKELLHGEKTERSEAESFDSAVFGGRCAAAIITHHRRNRQQQFKNLMVGVPLFEDGQQEPTRALVCISDVSDKRRSEVNPEKRLEFAEQHMQEFVTVETRGNDSNIVGVSRGFTQRTGFTSADVLGLNCLCLCGPGTERKAMRSLVFGLRHGGLAHSSLLTFKRAGEPQWLGVCCLPLKGKGAKLDDEYVPSPGTESGGSTPREYTSLLASTSEGPSSVHLCILSDITSSKQRRVGRYQLGRVIGKGASGVVRMGRDTQSGDIVAIKMVNASNFRSISEIELVQEEMRVLSSLNHANIIRLMDVLYAGNCIYFVMEYASGGSMVQYVWGHEGHKLDLDESKKLFRQMLGALDYCHRRRIVHRDLKPENILMDSDNNIKIADFGLAAIVSPFSSSLGQSVGTPEFAAPEIIGGKQYDGPAVDIWSMGVILYELTIGYLPFQGRDQREMFKRIMAGDMAPIPAWIPEQLRDLIKRMLTVSSERRITLEGIRAHPWAASPEDELGPEGGEGDAGYSDEEMEEDEGAGGRGGSTAFDITTAEFGKHTSASPSVWGAAGTKGPRMSGKGGRDSHDGGPPPDKPSGGIGKNSALEDSHASLALTFNMDALSRNSFKETAANPTPLGLAPSTAGAAGPTGKSVSATPSINRRTDSSEGAPPPSAGSASSAQGPTPSASTPPGPNPTPPNGRTPLRARPQGGAVGFAPGTEERDGPGVAAGGSQTIPGANGKRATTAHRAKSVERVRAAAMATAASDGNLRGNEMGATLPAPSAARPTTSKRFASSTGNSGAPPDLYTATGNSPTPAGGGGANGVSGKSGGSRAAAAARAAAAGAAAMNGNGSSGLGAGGGGKERLGSTGKPGSPVQFAGGGSPTSGGVANGSGGSDSPTLPPLMGGGTRVMNGERVGGGSLTGGKGPGSTIGSTPVPSRMGRAAGAGSTPPNGQSSGPEPKARTGTNPGGRNGETGKLPPIF